MIGRPVIFRPHGRFTESAGHSQRGAESFKLGAAFSTSGQLRRNRLVRSKINSVQKKFGEKFSCLFTIVHYKLRLVLTRETRQRLLCV